MIYPSLNNTENKDQTIELYTWVESGKGSKSAQLSITLNKQMCFDAKLIYIIN